MKTYKGVKKRNKKEKKGEEKDMEECEDIKGEGTRRTTRKKKGIKRKTWIIVRT